MVKNNWLNCLMTKQELYPINYDERFVFRMSSSLLEKVSGIKKVPIPSRIKVIYRAKIEVFVFIICYLDYLFSGRYGDYLYQDR